MLKAHTGIRDKELTQRRIKLKTQTELALDSHLFTAMRIDAHAQDNRATGHPIYNVQHKLRLADETDIWLTAQPFFTNSGAEEYIRRNGHNLNEPRIYISSGNDNPEWKMMREILRGDSKDI